jgi:hypothetical protein
MNNAAAQRLESCIGRLFFQLVSNGSNFGSASVTRGIFT